MAVTAEDMAGHDWEEVSRALYDAAEWLKQTEPYATATIADLESAAGVAADYTTEKFS